MPHSPTSESGILAHLTKNSLLCGSYAIEKRFDLCVVCSVLQLLSSFARLLAKKAHTASRAPKKVEFD